MSVCAKNIRPADGPQTAMKSLRILIADDHQPVRVLLRTILESIPEFEVCGEAATGLAVVASAKSLSPQVVVMDIVMPDCNGLDATQQILRVRPETRIILTTLHEFPAFADEAKRVGACGCFSKVESGRHLIPAVRKAAQRRPFFTSHDLEQAIPL